MSADNSKIVNYLIRMVVPLKREFSINLNVSQFCHDLAYAKEVIDAALTSQNPSLKEQAQYVASLTFGPRTGTPPPSVKTKQTLAADPTLGGTPPPASASSTKREKKAQEAASNAANQPATPLTPEEEMKAQIMKKYTSGLR